MAHYFVHGGLAQQRAGRGAVEIAGIGFAVGVGARPVGQNAVGFRSGHFAQGGEILAADAVGGPQRGDNGGVIVISGAGAVAKNDILNCAQTPLRRGQKLPDVAGSNGGALRQHRLNALRFNRRPVQQRAGTPFHHRAEPERLGTRPGRAGLLPGGARSGQRIRRRVGAESMQGIPQAVHLGGGGLKARHNYGIGQVNQYLLPGYCGGIRRR